MDTSTARERSSEVHSLLPFAPHIHVRGGAPGRLQIGVGENTIDFEGMISTLQDKSYNGRFCLEYVWIDWQGCNQSDNVSETILLRKQLRELFDRWK
jgi:hypothetical protein